MARLSKRQIYEREQAIHALIRRGASVRTIEDKLSKQYNCAKSTIRSHYNRVMQELIDANKEAVPELKATLLARAEHIFEIAMDSGNLRTALDTINTQAKIGGVLDRSEKKEDKTPDFITIAKRDNVRPINKKADND